jgi:hypothetical protein
MHLSWVHAEHHRLIPCTFYRGQDYSVLEGLVDEAQPVSQSQAEGKGSKAEKRLQRQVLMLQRAHSACVSLVVRRVCFSIRSVSQYLA